jgi:hypothetical protein
VLSVNIAATALHLADNRLGVLQLHTQGTHGVLYTVFTHHRRQKHTCSHTTQGLRPGTQNKTCTKNASTAINDSAAPANTTTATFNCGWGLNHWPARQLPYAVYHSMGPVLPPPAMRRRHHCSPLLSNAAAASWLRTAAAAAWIGGPGGV